MSRISRLSWFPFYVEDFMGGTATFTAEDVGVYVLCLLAQFNSAERRAIPADADSLRATCKGKDPSRRVMEKFEAITMEGEPYLRNRRMAAEWSKAKTEYEGRKRGADRINERDGERIAERHDERDDERYTLDNKQSTTNTPQKTSQKRSTPSAASRRKEGHDSWLSPYGVAWKERWGAESEPPYGQMAGLFRKPEESIGAEEMVVRWKRYLAAQKDPKSARPRWFVEGLGQWKAAETPKRNVPYFMTPEGQREERRARITRGLAVEPPPSAEELSALRPKGDA